MPHISFLGAGRMASAMVEGLLEKKVCSPPELACNDGGDGTAAQLAARTGVRAASKWLPAGVTGPWPSPAMMAEAKSAAGCPKAANDMPKAEINIPTCKTRIPPKRWIKAPASGPDTIAPR